MVKETELSFPNIVVINHSHFMIHSIRVDRLVYVSLSLFGNIFLSLLRLSLFDIKMSLI